MKTFSDDEMQSLMIDLIDGKLSGEIEVLVREQIEGSTHYRQEFEQLRQLLAAMRQLPAPQAEADEAMRHTFLQFLEAEKQQVAAAAQAAAAQAAAAQAAAAQAAAPEQLAKVRPLWPVRWWQAAAAQAAAAVLLMVVAFFGGRYSMQRQVEPRMALLEQEVRNSKNATMLAMLEQESALARLQAVNYSYEVPQPDAQMTEALANTLQFDSNANVRLEAAHALFRLAERPQVRAVLLKALRHEQEPDVQITLIEMLAKLNDQNAMGEMQRLMQNPDLLPIVRHKAAEALGKFYEQ